LQKWQARKSGEKAKKGTRVSTSDPHARAMHQPDGGLALSYNAQISTDAAQGLIVGVVVTQEPNDSGQLLPAVDRLEQRLEKKPQQMVADSGYSTRENIEKMARREIDFLGTMRYENVPRGANLPNRLSPSAFSYQPEKQSPTSGRTQEGARDDLPHLPSAAGGLPSLSSQTGVLPRQPKARPFGDATGRKPGCNGISQEDGQRESSRTISSPWKNRGVLSRLD
jgi:hypothetical protein